jgi:hypothetical protein
MSTAAYGPRRTSARQDANQVVALGAGALFMVVSILGFAATAGLTFAAPEGNLLFGLFEVNPLHNMVHGVIALTLLGAGLVGRVAARRANLSIGSLYLALGVLGFFIQDTGADALALNAADHFLHLTSSVVLIGVGLISGRREVRRR